MAYVLRDHTVDYFRTVLVKLAVFMLLAVIRYNDAYKSYDAKNHEEYGHVTHGYYSLQEYMRL